MISFCNKNKHSKGMPFHCNFLPANQTCLCFTYFLSLLSILIFPAYAQCTVLNGGHLNYSYCCPGFYQTQNSNLPCFQSALQLLHCTPSYLILSVLLQGFAFDSCFLKHVSLTCNILTIFLSLFLVEAFTCISAYISDYMYALYSTEKRKIGHICSTRVSNELGAGNSRAAQLSVCTVMVLAVAEAIMVSAALFCCRFILGYAYSSEKEVVDYVREMTPLLCLSIVMDSLTAILSGIARGSGWQHIGAYVNFGAYYLVGIPLAIVLGFLRNLRGEGIWGGIVTGTILQVILLTSATCLTNWQEQANKARERIFKGRILADKLIDQLN